MSLRIINGDCRNVLRDLPEKSVHSCVTSPPYWGLRDYGCAGQIGLESMPQEYLQTMVQVFAYVWRVLRDDATCWINLGDTYNAGTNAKRKAPKTGVDVGGWKDSEIDGGARIGFPGLKPKNLCGIPWRVAFAFQDAGWYLRQDIIWAKPNPMPESVTDRCTKSHEYIFLLTKSPRYYFDAEAIAEQAISDHASGNGFTGRQGGSNHLPMDGGAGSEKQWIPKGRGGKNAFRGQGHFLETPGGPANREGRDMQDVGASETRNKRSVWTVATAPYSEAHFATFPPDLIKPCILAGCPAGGTVLDPFGGSGTTGQVALELGRSAILIELNPDYCKLSDARTNVTPGLALT